MSSLANTLFSKTQQKVLGLLYGHPDRTFYTKEILRATGMGVATIKRELDRMLAAGILQMNRVGNQHHYQANPQCPIYPELLAIVRKTFGVADVLRSCLEPVLDDIDLAFVYGSVAKNEDTAQSDIDLMVVTDKLTYAEVMQQLVEAEEALGRSVNPGIYALAQVKKKLSQKVSFMTRVMDQPKIWIKGTDDDIGLPG
jgi:predicted nucleotidyltransferase